MKNKYRINDGIVSIEIKSKKKIFICEIDFSDFDDVNSINGTWQLSSTGYAYYKTTKGGKVETLWIHRMLLNVKETFVHVDHRDGNRLNNKRDNIRISDMKKNSQNISVRNDSKTGVRGVYYRKDRDKYVAKITTYGKDYIIGNFKSLELAEKHVLFARTILVPDSDRVGYYLPYAVERDKPSLYFRHGVMSSGKSELLLISNNVYRKLGKNVMLLSSRTNTRDCKDTISSRNGMLEKSLSISSDDNIYSIVEEKISNSTLDYILVDEIQFFTNEQIYQLATIVDELDITVICYGLKTDFKGKLFSSVEHLICIADVIQCIDYKCECGGYGIMNMRISNGKPVFSGKTIEIGAEERYKSVCRKCYFKFIKNKGCNL